MTPDQQRFLLACLAAHIQRNTCGTLSLSDADVRAAYDAEPEFRVRREKNGTVRVKLVE